MKANGWPLKRLDEVCLNIQDGAHRSPQVLFTEPAKGRFPYLTSKNIGEGFMKLARVEYCDAEFHNDIYPRCNVALGDVLLTKDGANTGNVAINTLEEPFSLLSSVCLLKTNPKLLHPKFLCYYLRSEDGLRQITGQMTGAAIKRIILKTIRISKIPLPPLAEQQRIVGILDEAFAGIATAKANAEKNLRNAGELFQSRLRDLFDVKGDKSWEPHRLAEVAKIFGRGKSRHRPRNEPKLYGGKYPFIQTGEVRNAERFVESYEQTYSEVGLAQSKLWPKGTVCITIAANIAETAILGFDACIPDSIIGLVVDDRKADNVFVLYLLRSFKAHLQAQGKGSAQDNINMGTFEEQLFPIPPLVTQRKIASQLDGLHDGVKHLESLYLQKLSALDALKKSLLHQAFSGLLSRPPEALIAG